MPDADPAADTQGALSDVARRGVQLFRFLAASQRLRTATVRKAGDYSECLWLNALPEHVAVESALRAPVPREAARLVGVRRVPPVDPPAAPEQIRTRVLDPKRQTSVQPAWRHEEDEATASPEELSLFSDWSVAWRIWASREQSDAPARSLYERLFRLAATLEAHPEEFEFVLGVGCLSWRPEGYEDIQRHLWTTPLTVEMESVSGDFIVTLEEPDAPILNLELEMVEPELIQSNQGVASARDQIRREPHHPMDRTEMADLGKQVTNHLSADGAYDDRDSAAEPSSRPVATFAPALLLRKRNQAPLVELFDFIAAEIESRGTVPAGLLPLLDPDQLPAAIPSAEAGAMIQADGEPFLPLPLNEVQLRILDHVDHNAQTLVQGPPGTGKTHTAAALISHLLAQGKRVLVTAKTDQALREVREKLPKPIQPLAVSVIGASRSELAELDTAVQTISEKADLLDQHSDRAAETHLLAQVDRLQRERAEARHLLLEVRRAETAAVTVHGWEGTPAAIAQQVTRQRAEHEWILVLGDASAEGPLPVPAVSVQGWYALLTDHRLAPSGSSEEREFRAADRQFVELAPPTPEQVRVRWEERLRASERCDATRPPSPGTTAWGLETLPADVLGELREGVGIVALAGRNLASGRPDWVGRMVHDIQSGLVAVWSARHERVGTLLRTAAPFVAACPWTDEIQAIGSASEEVLALVPDLLVVVERSGPLKTDGQGRVKLGLLTPRKVRDAVPFLESVTVNGHQPHTGEEIAAGANYLRALSLVADLGLQWPDGGPQPSGSIHDRFAYHEAAARELQIGLAHGALILGLEKRMSALRVARPDWRSAQALSDFVAAIDHILAKREFDAADQAFAALGRAFGDVDLTPPVQELARAFSSKDATAYAAQYSLLEERRKLGLLYAQRAELDGIVRAYWLSLADAVMGSADDRVWSARLSRLEDAWSWATTGTWLRTRATSDVNAVQHRIATIDDQLRELAGRLAASRAWSKALAPDRLTHQSRADLKQYAQLVRRLGKGTGKYAASRRAEIRLAMDRCRPSVPVWIMPIYRLTEQLDLHENLFDVVVVDEASQAGLDAVFLQYLAPRIVVIGDDRQVSPSAVGVNREQLDALAAQFLRDNVHSATWKDPERSLFDEADMRFGKRLTLVEHRRCVPEIIGFSNLVAYEPNNVKLIPVRQVPADRLPPIVDVPLVDGYEHGTTGNKVNRPEVEAVVAQIEQCLEDPRYDGLTFGVISLLGSRQAQLIETELMTRIPPEEWKRRELRCGDSASFQGAERNVMFLSMVTGHPERDFQRATQTRELSVQRYNVAVSRAKDQLWLFHTVTLEEIPNSEDMRHQLLTYCREVTSRGEVGELPALAPDDIHVPPFDSLFEQRIFNELVSRGYRVEPQVSALGYSIDLVVEGRTSRLAVECDGDQWHGPDQHERDMERQRNLERCQWRFHRIRESAYYVGPAETIAALLNRLAEVGIAPWGQEPEEPESPVSVPTPPEPASPVTPEEADVPEAPTSWVPRRAWHGGIGSVDAPEAASPVTPEETDDTDDKESLGSSPAASLPTPGEPDAPESKAGSELSEYVAFSGQLIPIGEASSRQVTKAIVDIVAAEGPISGVRLHRAYVIAAGGQRVGRVIASELNKAIAAALRVGSIVDDNPLHVQGYQSRAFRLPDQPTVRLRAPGPRELDEIPVRELAAVLELAAIEAGWDDSDALFREALRLLGWKRLTTNVRTALGQAEKIAR